MNGRRGNEASHLQIFPADEGFVWMLGAPDLFCQAQKLRYFDKPDFIWVAFVKEAPREQSVVLVQPTGTLVPCTWPIWDVRGLNPPRRVDDRFGRMTPFPELS